MDCAKLRKSGIPKKQRLELARLISEFFQGHNFPPHKALDAELADFLADRLPDLLCPPPARKILPETPSPGEDNKKTAGFIPPTTFWQKKTAGVNPAAQT